MCKAKPIMFSKALCALCVHLTLRSSRDKEILSHSPQRENKKPGTTLRWVFIIVGMNYFTIKRCVA